MESEIWNESSSNVNLKISTKNFGFKSMLWTIYNTSKICLHESEIESSKTFIFCVCIFKVEFFFLFFLKLKKLFIFSWFSLYNLTVWCWSNIISNLFFLCVSVVCVQETKQLLTFVKWFSVSISFVVKHLVCFPFCMHNYQIIHNNNQNNSNYPWHV